MHHSVVMILLAFKLFIRKHSKTLVYDSIIEQQLYVRTLFRLLASPQNDRWYCFFSNAIHDMHQEPISIMRFIWIKLTSELIFQFKYVYSLSVIHEFCWPIELSESISENSWERLILMSISILDEELSKLLIVREKMENSWHEPILCATNQLEITIKIAEILDFLFFWFGNFRENNIIDFSVLLNIFVF